MSDSPNRLLAISASSEHTNTTQFGGKIYIYRHNGSQFVSRVDLVCPDSVQAQGFGENIALSGNGSTLVCTRNDRNIYVFSMNGTTATLQSKISSLTGMTGTVSSLRISEDGNVFVLVLGKALYVYENSGGVWSVPFLLYTMESGTTQPYSMTSDGKNIAIADYRNPAGACVKTFFRSTNAWKLNKTITKPEVQNFGYAVEWSGDGRLLLVGSNNGTTGRVHFYKVTA